VNDIWIPCTPGVQSSGSLIGLVGVRRDTEHDNLGISELDMGLKRVSSSALGINHPSNGS
jgi:hypothetical protein